MNQDRLNQTLMAANSEDKTRPKLFPASTKTQNIDPNKPRLLQFKTIGSSHAQYCSRPAQIQSRPFIGLIPAPKHLVPKPTAQCDQPGQVTSCHRSLPKNTMLDVGCWMLDVGCRMMDVGCWMLDVGCRMLDVGGWMLDVGCRM
jgi:hypothetical protein